MRRRNNPIELYLKGDFADQESQKLVTSLMVTDWFFCQQSVDFDLKGVKETIVIIYIYMYICTYIFLSAVKNSVALF